MMGLIHQTLRWIDGGGGIVARSQNNLLHRLYDACERLCVSVCSNGKPSRILSSDERRNLQKLLHGILQDVDISDQLAS